MYVGEGSTARFYDTLSTSEVGVRSVTAEGTDFAGYQLIGGCVRSSSYVLLAFLVFVCSISPPWQDAYLPCFLVPPRFPCVFLFVPWYVPWCIIHRRVFPRDVVFSCLAMMMMSKPCRRPQLPVHACLAVSPCAVQSPQQRCSFPLIARLLLIPIFSQGIHHETDVTPRWG